MAPGSRSPARVPITRPSIGVNPMLVSILSPSRMAHTLAPLQRRERDEFANCAEDNIIDDRRSFEARSAVHNANSDGIDVAAIDAFLLRHFIGRRLQRGTAGIEHKNLHSDFRKHRTTAASMK